MSKNKDIAKRENKTSPKKAVEKALVGGRVEKETVKLKPHQKAVSNFLRTYKTSVVLGDAGCAKDFVQMYRALEGLKNKEFEKLGIKVNNKLVEESKSLTTKNNNVTSDILFKITVSTSQIVSLRQER